MYGRVAGEDGGERERRGRWTEGGEGPLSERAGRINKRGAPPSHLGHLYFAAPHGRKSSSVSERGYGEEASKKGGRECRVKDHGHLPRS